MRLIFKNELKRALKRRYIIAFVFIALILQGFIQVGKFKHLDNIENRNSLKKVESSKVSHYVYFRQYASLGITMMFVPSNFGILYNDSTFELLLCNTNIGDNFNIFLPKKGKELFDDSSPFLNFMGVSLLLIFYFGILYGIDTTINRDYLKFLSSRSDSKKVIRFIIFFRLILLNAAFLLLFVINISLLLLNNINLFRLHLLPFCWGLFLAITFSFAIGCILGSIKSNFKRDTAFFVIFVLSVILLPLLLNFFTRLKSSDIKPVFEFDHENLKTVMIEEDMLIKKYGVLPLNIKPSKEENIDTRQSIFNQAKKIRENLKRLRNKLKSKVRARKLTASFFPTLYYFSLSEDASTNSYDAFIEFYSFSQNKKDGFVNYCVDKIYPLTLPKDKDKPGKQSNQESQENQGDEGNQNDRPRIESFIKDDEDLFFAKSKIPMFFWLGNICSLLWIAGSLLIASLRTLKQIKGEPGKIRDFDVKMKPDELNYLLTADEGLKSQTYNSLTGDGFTSVNIKVDEEILEQKDFIYVYETIRFLKDIDQKSLYKELFGKEMPGDLKPWQFLIHYAAESNKLLLLDNFFKGMDVNEIEKFIDAVKKSGINVLYIGDEYFQAVHLDDHVIFCKDDESIPGIAEKVKSLRRSNKQS
ncbi:MAG: hypothetical protein JSV88_33385 [Candidatus Aminicenantes bacterium]|nr:MAG: hypothetical protein JSV88_33385 [Candidatus Aminicenantes bacterium]